jgi:hypothetical protein
MEIFTIIFAAIAQRILYRIPGCLLRASTSSLAASGRGPHLLFRQLQRRELNQSGLITITPAA